ncbi:hypothetical protein HDU83_000431, partial [Entophlyctis luteolus]
QSPRKRKSLAFDHGSAVVPRTQLPSGTFGCTSSRLGRRDLVFRSTKMDHCNAAKSHCIRMATSVSRCHTSFADIYW